MKNTFSLFIILLFLQQNVWSQCNAGAYVVTTNTTINGSCKITGDLTILNGATLNVDLTSAQLDTFVVQGNILLQGNAVLWVHAAPGSIGEQFIVSNLVNNQRTITTEDSSRIQLENIEFRTQEGNLANTGSVYMNYNAKGSSVFYVNNSKLNTQKAWLLCNMFNQSTLIGYESNELPTEIYLQDTAQVSLHGSNTKAGIWLNFQSITDTLDLPLDQSSPYNWKVGRGVGGLDTQWYLEVDTVQLGLGVQIFPSAKMTINGSGLPATGEVKVALMFANNTDSLKNLNVGLQDTIVANGPVGFVKLNNVNLGPIAWQIYALMNEHLHIKNSIINEIGIAGPSSVTVDNSLLQLAVLGAVGVGGCTMTLNNSEIWNQVITAANHSTMTLNNCHVTGSEFSTVDAQSHITVNGGCFFQNPSGCTENTMVNINTGQPFCNPFIPPGFPQNLTPATVTFNGVNSNCIEGITQVKKQESSRIFPNPCNESFVVEPLGNNDQILQVSDLNGTMVINRIITGTTTIDTLNLSEGIYNVSISDDKSIGNKRLVIVR